MFAIEVKFYNIENTFRLNYVGTFANVVKIAKPPDSAAAASDDNLIYTYTFRSPAMLNEIRRVNELLDKGGGVRSPSFHF
jgi:hypothetical protein